MDISYRALQSNTTGKHKSGFKNIEYLEFTDCHRECEPLNANRLQKGGQKDTFIKTFIKYQNIFLKF